MLVLDHSQAGKLYFSSSRPFSLLHFFTSQASSFIFLLLCIIITHFFILKMTKSNGKPSSSCLSTSSLTLTLDFQVCTSSSTAMSIARSVWEVVTPPDAHQAAKLVAAAARSKRASKRFPVGLATNLHRLDCPPSRHLHRLVALPPRPAVVPAAPPPKVARGIRMRMTLR